MSRKSNKSNPREVCNQQSLLDRGLAHHRAGSLCEASDCYAAILKANPAHADALNLLGVIARQQGRLAESEALVCQAIEHNPSAATYHHSLARTFALKGNIPQAICSYRQALALNPRDADSLQMLADLLSQSGETHDAIKAYTQLLTLAPDRSEIYLLLSSLCQKAGDLQQAIDHARKAVELFPQVAECHFYLADCLTETTEPHLAIPIYRAGLELQPQHVAAQTRLATLLSQVGYTAEAQAAYHQALRLNPDTADVLSNLSTLPLGWNDLRTAEVLLLRALERDPNLIMANCNLGAVYERQGRYLEATECFRKALTTDPSHVATLGNLGLTLGHMGDHEGAITCYELALARQPQTPTIEFNLSLEYLAGGDLLRGFAAYESRWRTQTFAGKCPTYPQPQWHGEDITGRTILIHSEQGLGDTLQFVRFVPLVAQRGARIILQIQSLLIDLLEDTSGAAQVLSNEEDPTHFDVHIPMMSLPAALGTTLETIPPPLYLQPERHPSARALAHHLEAPGLRVGLVWSGNPEHLRDRHRSLPLTTLAPLFALEGITFFSLQKGPSSAQLNGIPVDQRPIDLAPHLANFTHTAEAIRNLDLVLTVDTAVCHLAGTLGKPVWILLPHVADWRWLRDRTDNPWYPRARLFRQSIGGRWDQVIDQVCQELNKLMARAASPTSLPFAATAYHEAVQL